ncbi:putative histidine decarboxylase [Apostichopus japonicus]|uniref:Histidine decarboxylase n=1 Tax=Stichopus japonicus TaxID=307972 RepID=A0A2G8L5K7_STIJA|nr:putative histidine decarboxylase [Apostichopus japonicus]
MSRTIGNNGDKYFTMKYSGKEMVDLIADYLSNIRSRRTFPNVEPGYMKNLVPDTAPENGEDWEDVVRDIERVIMPGITHWQSPHMHAYFPALNSFPSLLGDMLADGINCLGFTWAASPACTELEKIVMDWLGDMLGLPDFFSHRKTESKGGGVIQGTLSEATLVAMLAARHKAINTARSANPDLEDLDDAEMCSRLVAYCSDQAHSSIEKNTLITMVRLRHIETDDELSLRGQKLEEAIEEDTQLGLIPFFVCATLGTTGACAFDNLKEIGKVCEKRSIWLHVDAAYAGSAFICPEFRRFTEGIERIHSFAFNPSKWLMVHFDCTAFWVRDSEALEKAFCVNPLYLRHHRQGDAIDFMHWQIPLSRRFRALKLWFVLRSFGVENLQKHIRKGVELAKYFETLVSQEQAFEIQAERHLGLVIFRLKGPDCLTEELLRHLNATGKLYMVPASVKGKYVIRFTTTSTHTTEDDITKDWKLIRSYGMKIIGGNKIFPPITRNASWPVSHVAETLPSPNEKPPGIEDRRPVAVEVEVKNHKRRARSEDIFSYGFPFNAYYSLQKDARLLVGAMPPANEEGEDEQEEDDVFEEDGDITSPCNGCGPMLMVPPPSNRCRKSP